QQGVDNQPFAVVTARLREEAAANRGRLAVREIRRIRKRYRCRLSQRPQRSLFRNRFGRAADGPIAHPRPTTDGAAAPRRLHGLVPADLRAMEALPKKSVWRLVLGWRVVGRLGIQFVMVVSQRHQENAGGG